MMWRGWELVKVLEVGRMGKEWVKVEKKSVVYIRSGEEMLGKEVLRSGVRMG